MFYVHAQWVFLMAMNIKRCENRMRLTKNWLGNLSIRAGDVVVIRVGKLSCPRRDLLTQYRERANQNGFVSVEDMLERVMKKKSHAMLLCEVSEIWQLNRGECKTLSDERKTKAGLWDDKVSAAWRDEKFAGSDTKILTVYVFKEVVELENGELIGNPQLVSRCARMTPQKLTDKAFQSLKKCRLLCTLGAREVLFTISRSILLIVLFTMSTAGVLPQRRKASHDTRHA